MSIRSERTEERGERVNRAEEREFFPDENSP